MDYICSSSLDDIVGRHLVDILERDIAIHKANSELTASDNTSTASAKIQGPGTDAHGINGTSTVVRCYCNCPKC